MMDSVFEIFETEEEALNHGIREGNREATR
jgi:hypothetical protein